MIENIDKWRQAGRIAAEALEYAKSLVKNGAMIREVSDKIDEKIIQLGAEPAWPTQISCDEIAAHYTPEHDDETLFDNNLVCIDVGAHVDGCVGDNAWTVDLSGKYSDLVKASQNALAESIKVLRAGVTLGEIGKTIQDTIQSHGAIPVRNLSGHGIEEWEIHAFPGVPNIATNDPRKLEAGKIIAIEPFTTKGVGLIREAEQAEIFEMDNPKPVRSPYARDVVEFIEENYENLPFCKRWLVNEFGLGKTNLAMRELMRNEILHPHPPLIEKGKGMVAQFEKTMLITEDGCEVLTKL